jgi:hypothetical protein
MAFFVEFALFFRTIDGMLRYDRVRYGTLENSDKHGLPIVYVTFDEDLKKWKKTFNQFFDYRNIPYLVPDTDLKFFFSDSGY